MDNLKQVETMFPGQTIAFVPYVPGVDAAHYTVAHTPENEALLKRRGHFYDRSKGMLLIYFPDMTLLND